MDEDRWSDIAFSLGVSARPGQRHSNATRRLAQKMSKRTSVSPAQTCEQLKSFIDTLLSTCPTLSQQTKCSYHSDAVPTVDAFRNTVHRLPTPRPVISIGYCSDAFSETHRELQHGIIAGSTGEPCDLNRISQPVAGHFWPFLVVEVSDESMAAARRASAVSAATCNNALSLLAEAAWDYERDWSNSPSIFDRRSAKSFSLSIHGKTASLGAHGTEGAVAHVASEVATYDLKNEDEVAALADRLHGIMVWAHYNRLAEVLSTLDRLDRKVHGGRSGSRVVVDGHEFDPHCLKVLQLQAPRRPRRTKAALKAGLPSWLSR